MRGTNLNILIPLVEHLKNPCNLPLNWHSIWKHIHKLTCSSGFQFPKRWIDLESTCHLARPASRFLFLSQKMIKRTPSLFSGVIIVFS